MLLALKNTLLTLVAVPQTVGEMSGNFAVPGEWLRYFAAPYGLLGWDSFVDFGTILVICLLA